MNKQELIEKYEKLEGVWNANGAEIARQCFLRDLKQLNAIDTKKVTVPQFVADWIEKIKGKGEPLYYALDHTPPEEVDLWFCEDEVNRQNILARAWLDGYTVEEKRYKVKVKGVYFNSGLVFDKTNKKWFFSSIYEVDHQRGHHTRKELEEAGFGEVFNSPLFEVEEVEGEI